MKVRGFHTTVMIEAHCVACGEQLEEDLDGQMVFDTVTSAVAAYQAQIIDGAVYCLPCLCEHAGHEWELWWPGLPGRQDASVAAACEWRFCHRCGKSQHRERRTPNAVPFAVTWPAQPPPRRDAKELFHRVLDDMRLYGCVTVSAAAFPPIFFETVRSQHWVETQLDALASLGELTAADAGTYLIKGTV